MPFYGCKVRGMLRLCVKILALAGAFRNEGGQGLMESALALAPIALAATVGMQAVATIRRALLPLPSAAISRVTPPDR